MKPASQTKSPHILTVACRSHSVVTVGTLGKNPISSGAHENATTCLLVPFLKEAFPPWLLLHREIGSTGNERRYYGGLAAKE